jgi:antitoxin YefM
MNSKLESKLPDADMQAAPRALLRAAHRARELARQTGTLLVVVRNGVLLEMDPDSADFDEEDATSPIDTVMTAIEDGTASGTIRCTMGRTTPRINLNTDIKPLSEFRANAAQLIEQVKTSGRRLVLTQRGRSAAVLLDVADYEQMVDEMELLRDLQTAVQQIGAGHAISNREAKAELRRRFRG